MHGFEASDGVVTTNIDTTIAATRIGSLRLTSDTDVASNQISLMASLETDACKLWRGLNKKIFFLFINLPAQRVHDPLTNPFFFWHRQTTNRGGVKTTTA